ncbi:MAG: ketopantoate reductase family protein [Treponema sp.]|jgi:2-dehydropantoate 2-reductase|nr:ketopantoate reductase family protein [Treponema sp.]
MIVNPIKTVLIAGAGAVGLTVAETLYRYDPHCVAILAGGERLKHYRKSGLWINGERFNVIFADTAAANAAFATRTTPVDLIIIASKYHHLQQIIADIKPYAGSETIIISLLNGISSEDIIGKVYGREKLPLAMIIGTDAQRLENRVIFSRRGTINFGDADGRDTERDQKIAEFFTRAGLPFEYHRRDMKRTFWYKFMINVGVNQTSALLRLPYSAFKKGLPAAVPEAMDMLESAMREVIAISEAEGINLNSGDIEQWYKTVTLLDDAGSTSMCQDVLACRKTEVEIFGRTVMEYGKKHGIPTPVNEALYKAIRAMEQDYLTVK